MKKYILISLAAIAVLMAVVYLTLQYQKLRFQAVDNCLQLSGTYQYTSTNLSEKSTLPQKEVYKACLLDKGITSSWK
ncbi:MAG: hypothetical protein WC686_04180 [Candidatus Shapirobacteria bacterium]|jgi:hypothetical protein